MTTQDLSTSPNTSTREMVARHAASPWYFRGPDAARVRSATVDQVNFAITLRRQTASRLEHQARMRAAVCGADPFWLSIANACRREVRRCERADRRLATLSRATGADTGASE